MSCHTEIITGMFHTNINPLFIISTKFRKGKHDGHVTVDNIYSRLLRTSHRH